MSAYPSLSIVIANFNYESYVADAIESALRIDWPHIEVIVVDDGSTDGSRAQIEAFGRRVHAIFQANQGQRVANNVGFAASTGDAILFLDADDALDPAIGREVFAVWNAQLSKVQVQMARTDADGRPLGSILPQLRSVPSSEAIRNWATRSGEYPSPPGSGNIYARRYLEAIFPLGEGRDSFTDTTCIAMAPFFGDVVTVAKPLVFYRMHGANDSSLMRDERHYAREISRAEKRLCAARDAGDARGFAAQAPDVLFEGKHLLQLRIASLRLRPDEHPLPGDTRLRALKDALLVPFRSGHEPLARRLLIAGWSLLALLLPDRSARRLIRWRFEPKASLRYRLGTRSPVIAE